MANIQLANDPVFLNESTNYGLIFEVYLDEASGEQINYSLYNKHTKYIDLRLPNYPSALEVMARFEEGIRKATGELDKLSKTSNVVAIATKNQQH